MYHLASVLCRAESVYFQAMPVKALPQALVAEVFQVQLAVPLAQVSSSSDSETMQSYAFPPNVSTTDDVVTADVRCPAGDGMQTRKQPLRIQPGRSFATLDAVICRELDGGHITPEFRHVLAVHADGK